MKHTVKSIIISLSLICYGVAYPLQAEILKYVDGKGGVHFTDRPMKGNYKLVWRSGSGNTAVKNYGAFKNFQKNKTLVSPLINATAKQSRLHPGLLHALVMVESAYDPQAISVKGAEGLMQLMPGTASRYKVQDSFDPIQNLEGGTRYLKDLLLEFKFDVKLALAAYNAGENAVRKYGNQIPPYPETQDYVEKVMGLYRENIRAGEY